MSRRWLTHFKRWIAPGMHPVFLTTRSDIPCPRPFKRDNEFYRVREGDPFGNPKSFAKTRQFWSRLIVPSTAPAPTSERELVLLKTESFQVPAIIADVGPEAAKRFFQILHGSRRSFKLAWKESVTRLGYC